MLKNLPYAFKEIRHHKRDLRLILFILSVALTALMLTSIFESSSYKFIESRQRDILGADISLSTLSALKPEQIESVKSKLQPSAESRTIEFLSMIRANETSILAEIRAVDSSYPLTGHIKIAPFGELNSNFIYVYPEVLAQLNLKLGESLKVGESTFTIGAEVIEDLGLSRTNFGAAPRIYIPIDDAKATGLIEFGSQVSYAYQYTLVQPFDMKTQEGPLRDLLDRKDLYIRVPASTARGISNAVGYFKKYLALLSLLITLLCFLSGFYLLQIYLKSKVKAVAIYQLYGLSRWQIQGIYFSQILFIMLGSLFCALALSGLIVFGANSFMAQTALADFRFGLFATDVLFGLIVSLASALVFYLPFAFQIRSVSTNQLLAESDPQMPAQKGISQWVPQLTSAVGFFTLAAWFMGSALQAFYFTATISIAAIITILILPMVFQNLGRRLKGDSPLIKYAFLNIGRARFATVLNGLGLILIGFLISLIPNILSSTTSELKIPKKENLPEFFVINIPEQEVPKLKQFAEEKKVKLKYVSPFILARLNKVNDEPPKRKRFQKFPIRISYRGELAPSEAIIEGKNFAKTYIKSAGELPQISMEHRYALRNNFNIGDILEFDVGGLPLKAQVGNLRRVNWASFQPNFFMQFQLGVLEGFPKTFIGVIYDVGKELRNKFQFELSNQFTSLSIIDLSRTIEKLISVTDRLNIIVISIGWVALLTAFLMLLLLSLHNISIRGYEIDLYKMTGLSAHQSKNLLSLEYFFYGMVSIIIGSTLGLVGAWFVAVYVLPTQPNMLWGETLLANLFFIVILIAIIRWRSRQMIQGKYLKYF